MGIPYVSGFKRALSEKFPDLPIDEETDRSGFIGKSIYHAFLVDSQLFLDDVKYHHNKFIETF